MQFSRKVKVDLDKLTIDGSANDRLSSEDYYKQYAGGRTDVWCAQARYGKEFLCNVFFEVGGRSPQMDWHEVTPDEAFRAEVLKRATENFKAGFTQDKIEAHLQFFRRMKKLYGIYWAETRNGIIQP